MCGGVNVWRTSALAFCLCLGAGAGRATSSPPPMLDIPRQCDSVAHHNVTAMSECVVAESEARSDILQKWEKLPDATARKCLLAGHKAKRFPYGAIAKCVDADTFVAPPPAAPVATDPKK